MTKRLSLLLVVALIISILCGCHNVSETPETSVLETTLPHNSEPLFEKPTNTSLSYGFIDHTMFSFFLTDGIYCCGDDFEPGDYYIISLYSTQALYDVCDNPNDFEWSDRRIIRKVHVEEGQYVDISHCIFVREDDLDTNNLAQYGIFLVGKDLPAGNYKIVNITDKYRSDLKRVSGVKGAYQICNDFLESEPVDCYPLFDQQSYISLENGQYLIINNLKLTLNGSTSDDLIIPTEPIETTIPVTEAEKVSQTYEAYLTATSLTKYDLRKVSSPTGTKYYYADIPLLSEDAEWIENPSNTFGTVNQGAVYRKLAKLLDGYFIQMNDGSDYSQIMFGNIATDEFSSYAEAAYEFITNDDSLYHVLKKFESLACTEGEFDYENNYWSFYIADLTQCTGEMKISEEMLGYIFAMLDEYAPTITFDGNSCTFEYESMFDFGFEDQAVTPISKEDFLVEIPVGSNAVNIYDYMISDGYQSYYCYYDPSADPSKNGVIKTNRNAHLGDSKEALICKYGESNSNAFITQNNVLYQYLLEFSPTEAGIMRSQCRTYISYVYENLGAIEFYFDENDLLSWIVFYAY